MKRLLLILLLLPVSYAHASPPFLERFRSSPAIAMDETPAKYGARVDSSYLNDKILACRRDYDREQILRSVFLRGRFAAVAEEGQDRPELFLENQNIVSNINALDEKYRQGQVDVQPWSGDYWPISAGAIAKRYNDPAFPGLAYSGNWLEAFEYFKLNKSTEIKPELLSPAEKYDVVADDKNFSLTEASWDEGKRYNDKFNKVEGWMGLCHGWAPASFMEPRPSKVYSAKTLDGQEEVTFLPDDMKAILTLKWANGINATPDLRKSGTRFLGGRCNVKEPKKDPESGRIIDPQCFDLNPGSWHVVITNQIAGEHRPLIIDAAFDFEVWNQPVSAYTYSYFNPKTLKPTRNLKEAIVNMNDPEFKDKFKSYRNNPNAVSVVGVNMTVSYMAEVPPSDKESDSEEFDRRLSVDYFYDLELDANNNIVGGEWYQNRHPDFVWMPVKNSIAVNFEDLQATDDESAKLIAPGASQQRIPLRYIINKILGAP